MQLKQFVAATEALAISAAKAELGDSVVIIGVREIRPTGFFWFFKPSRFEVTVANDSYAVSDSSKNSVPSKSSVPKRPSSMDARDRELKSQQERIKSLEQKLLDTELLFDNVVLNLSKSIEERKASKSEFESEIIALFFDTLVANEVLPDVAKEILHDANELVLRKPDLDINVVVKMVYNKIIRVIGTPRPLVPSSMCKESTTKVFFFGPTGVGKTTTIAKLSAKLMLDYNKEVALVTADTYRIAAVEQLRTYADILSLPLTVCYDKEELSMALAMHDGKKDVVFVDTAGRSHKNVENKLELKELLEGHVDACSFLVLSLTTKMADLFKIASSFSEISDFNVIFTKSDETVGLGAILNICYKLGVPVSYVTNGQNVPDDIEVIEPERIARALLGSNE